MSPRFCLPLCERVPKNLWPSPTGHCGRTTLGDWILLRLLNSCAGPWGDKRGQHDPRMAASSWPGLS